MEYNNALERDRQSITNLGDLRDEGQGADWIRPSDLPPEVNDLNTQRT